MKYLLLVPFVSLAACQTTVNPAKVYYPVEKCGDVQVPQYGVLDRPASSGEVVGGAATGAIIGKILTDDDAGAILGGLIGGGIASETRRQERVIVGYETQHVCAIVYE